MRAAIQPWSVVGLLASLSTAIAYDLHGPYFVLNHGPPLVSERLDPVISPGQNPSNHVHNVFGASSFSPTFDFAASQTAKCNTHGVKVDMSNYWYPAMYFHDKSAGTYKMVPTQLETYYHFDPMNGKARTAFPAGFKMLSGNAMLRHNDSSTNVNTASIKWNCHGPDNVITEGGFGEGFTTCPSYPGYSAEIWFPFCWDGSMDFSPADPSAHIVFGQGGDGTPTQQGGDCPSTHPTPLPQIFAEFHHDMSGFTWGADEQPFVLAQGDPLGFGMHMDFVSGWDVDTLQSAISLVDGTNTKCRVGESGDPLSDCFEMIDPTGCTIDSVVEGDGDVTNPGSALPGCNPLQSGPQDATIQTTCAGYKAPTVQTTAAGGASSAVPSAAGSATGGAPSATGGAPPVMTSSGMPPANSGSPFHNGPPNNGPPNNGPPHNGPPHNGPPSEKEAAAVSHMMPASSSAPPSPAESGPASSGSGDDAAPSTVEVSGSAWAYQGCYSDLTPDRSIRTLPWAGPVNSGKNADACAIACNAAGYKIAGIEFGWQCYCGHALNAQGKKLADTECNMACAGSNEACGGNGAIQVYAAKGVSLTKRSPHVHRHIRDFGGK